MFQFKYGLKGESVCSHSHYKRTYSEYYLYSDCTVSGGFAVIWIILLSRIVSSKRKLHEISSYVAYFNVVSMSLCTCFLSFVDYNRGEICPDIFG